VIFPFLSGLMNPLRTPITYFLIGVNLFVFAVTFKAYTRADGKMDEILADDEIMTTQGAAFAVMIKRENTKSAGQFSKTLTELARQALGGESEAKRVLGSLALRNREFASLAENYDFGGDEVAIETWRKKFRELLTLQESHPSFQWGITQRHESWLNWFTYQFAHSGWAHLFWNMIFLVIFGVFVEGSLGGGVVILTYLGGGLAGALAFSILSGISSSPLVGASAAISGLMGLVTVTFWRSKLKFFYWLLPVRGYHGFVWLPAWVVMIVYAIPDVSGYLSSAPEMGSIAYSAHLGGTVFGALIALIFFRNQSSALRALKAEPIDV
jgi:membrane associated rhomboid family serine protease